jgi:hypothetical protein
VLDRLETVAVGIVLLTVPAAAVDAIGIAEIPYTGGLVRVIDLDTIFFVLSCGLTLAFVARSAEAPTDRPYLVYAIGLSVVTIVLMAYVVTNLGTLFRLRLIPSTWIWLLPLAMAARSRVVMGRPSRIGQTQPVGPRTFDGQGDNLLA